MAQSAATNSNRWWSAVEMAERVQQGDVSPIALVEAALAQLDRVNPMINAVVTRADDAARAAADELVRRRARGEALGPLAGVPLVVKDLHLTAGLRTTFGSRLYENFTPDHDCPFVARLRAAGAIVIGKANASEFGLLPLTSNALFGPSRNPWTLDYDTGGSSGGSAAAVACGVAPIATGSDGGGSIRVPAAWCGVYGLKPQFGRIPRAFHFRGWETLTHDGPITRSVRDAARVLDVAAGFDAADRWATPAPAKSFEAACDDDARGLRMAWCPRLGQLLVEPEMAEQCRSAAQRFRELGCEVEEIELDLPDLGPAQQTIVLAECWAAFGSRRDEWERLGDPRMARMLHRGERITAAELQRAQWARDDYWERLSPVFERFDALATPVTAIEGARAGTLGPREIDGVPTRALAWLSHCVVANMTGQPACSLPIGDTRGGLPLGLQLVGRPHDEWTLLTLSAAYERAFPREGDRPPLA